MKMTESRLRSIIRSVIRETAESSSSSGERLRQHNTDQSPMVSSLRLAYYVRDMNNILAKGVFEYGADPLVEYGFKFEKEQCLFGKNNEPRDMKNVTEIVEVCFKNNISKEDCIKASIDEYTHRGGGMYNLKQLGVKNLD